MAEEPGITRMSIPQSFGSDRRPTVFFNAYAGPTCQLFRREAANIGRVVADHSPHGCLGRRGQVRQHVVSWPLLTRSRRGALHALQRFNTTRRPAG